MMACCIQHRAPVKLQRCPLGVWVVFEDDTEYIRRCFTEYGVRTDPSGRYACLYKRWHLIGLAHGWKVTRPVAAGALLRWSDVVVDDANSAVRVRRDMEQMYAAQ